MTHDVGTRIQALTMLETGHKIPEIITATDLSERLYIDSAKRQKNEDTILMLARNSSLLKLKMLLALEGRKRLRKK